jgi:hypothetical protein
MLQTTQDLRMLWPKSGYMHGVASSSHGGFAERATRDNKSGHV